MGRKVVTKPVSQPKKQDATSRDFVPEAKVLRVFQCIQCLAQPSGATITEIAEQLSHGERTVYRYLKLLEKLGYAIDKRPSYQGAKERYFLFEPPSRKRQLYAEDLTDKESDLLQMRLADLGEHSPLLASLRQKMYVTAALVPLPEQVRWARQARLLDSLTNAIAERQRVRLLRYHSTNTNTIRDWVVEPLELTNKFTQLSATDVETGQARTLNVSRIGGVESLDEPSILPDAGHRPDIFGMAATQDWQPLDLLLTERAYRLLLSEHPGAERYCEPAPVAEAATWPHLFRGQIRGFEGAARFVMGLPTEVRVVGPDSFRDKVRAKILLAQWWAG